MFRIVRNRYISETKLVDTVVREIRDRLPSRWALLNRGEEVRVAQGIGRTRVIDAMLELQDPQGLSTSIVVDVKETPVEPNRVSFAAETLRELTRLLSKRSGARRSCSYAAVTLLQSSGKRETGCGRHKLCGFDWKPQIVCRQACDLHRNTGSGQESFQGKPSLQSLKGSRAARAVRSFLDYRPPFGTRELVGETQNSLATVSRVSDLLVREAIIVRDGPRGRISSVDWETLVRRWAMDYEFMKANSPTTYLEPRGASVLFDRLREADFRYAVTGSFAAVRLAPVAEPRLVTLYAADPGDAADRLGLRPAETGGNVVIARPFDPVVFERTEIADGITYARVTQVLLDLMTGPGRGPAEAEGLLEWMREK